jgi:hypothetical protein
MRPVAAYWRAASMPPPRAAPAPAPTAMCQKLPSGSVAVVGLRGCSPAHHDAERPASSLRCGRRGPSCLCSLGGAERRTTAQARGPVTVQKRVAMAIQVASRMWLLQRRTCVTRSVSLFGCGRPHAVAKLSASCPECSKISLRFVKAHSVSTTSVGRVAELDIIVFPVADRADLKRSRRSFAQSEVPAARTRISR